MHDPPPRHEHALPPNYEALFRVPEQGFKPHEVLLGEQGLVGAQIMIILVRDFAGLMVPKCRLHVVQALRRELPQNFGSLDPKQRKHLS